MISFFIFSLNLWVFAHKILEKAIDKPEIATVYGKKVKNSLEIAKKYREKINPIDKVLPIHDIKDIREKVINRVKSELNLRITKRYININLSLVEKLVDISLKELKII
ncbi:hypothetical protein J4217_04515 [Candidatus Pacearchaeota archaeon]|nr:hypothetical protein [Candidatus Pacearchaeota archaeon]